MSAPKVIDIESWDRKEQFHFFRHYDSPYFGLTATLDITDLLSMVRARKYSFLAAYLFASQCVVNSIPEFGYRLKGGQVLSYPDISAGTTVMKENQVFTFCYYDHDPDFASFQEQVLRRTEECRQAKRNLEPRDHDLAQIYYSIIPWVHFTSVLHPRNHGTNDSVPRIVFGKMIEQDGKATIPVGVEAHHALLDGYHVGLYYTRLQEYFSDPQGLLER